MTTLHVTGLGQLNFALNDSPIAHFPSAKAQALLLYLAVEGHRSQRRDTLATLFWPERGEEAARRNLRQTLYRIKQSLDAVLPKSYDTLIATTREEIKWQPAASLTVDLHTFEAQLARVANHSHRYLHLCTTCLELLTDALALYQGDFAPGLSLPDAPEFERWLLLQREQLHRRYVATLATVANAYDARGEAAQAEYLLHRLLAAEPWREEAHRQLIQLLDRQGRRSDAIAQYQRCQTLLRTELQVAPSAETAALYAQLVAASPPLPAPALSQPLENRPAPQPLAHSGTGRAALFNFPTELTPFVGREEEIDQILTQLINPDCRLLTIVGVGGVGKSRLAKYAVREFLQRPPTGTGHYESIVFCPLADAHTLEMAIATLFHALQLVSEQGQEPVAQLCTYLARHHTLLILDNVEQLLVGMRGGHFVDLLLRILSAAPTVKCIVTSREALNVRGEWRLALAGLPVPEMDAPPATVLTSGAGQLFLQAATHYLPRFVPTDDELQAILRLCHLVQGLPLALEIAAAWLRMMACSTITAEIAKNLDFLEAPMRDLPERHRSLRAVFTYSWQLLTAEEQAAFARFAVFAGSFDLAAARAITGISPFVLGTLVDKSLVQRNGEGRYVLHELLKQYAAEQLPRVEATVVGALPGRTIAQQHAHYYLSLLISDADRDWVGVSPATLQVASEELENIHSAWDSALHANDMALLRQVCAPLMHIYRRLGYLHEAAQRFAAAATQVGALATTDAALDEMVAVLTYFAGRAWQANESFAEASTYLEAAHRYWTVENDARLAAAATIEWGINRWRQGHHDVACRLIEAGYAIAEAAGDHHCHAYAAHHLGNLSLSNNEFQRSQQYHAQALEGYRRAGDPIMEAALLNDQAVIKVGVGDYVGARGLLEESYRRAEQLTDRAGMLLPLGNLAFIALLDGDYEEAARVLEQTITLGERFGQTIIQLAAYNNWGHLHALQGNLDQAAQQYQIASQLNQHVGDLHQSCVTLAGWAYLLASWGDYDQAVALISTLQQTKHGFENSFDRLEHQLLEEALALAEAALPASRLQRAQACGAQRSLAAAHQLILAYS